MLKSTSWNSKFLVQIHELQVEIHDFKFTSYEFSFTSYKFKFTNYEFKSTSYEFKCTSYEFKFTGYELSQRVASSNPWVTILNLRVASRLLVESTKIENASFPYKTVISEANVKINRILSKKWTYHKGRSFGSNYFFWEFCFSLRTSYKELIWCTNDPNAYIPTFCKRWSFIWRCFFLLSIVNFERRGLTSAQKSHPSPDEFGKIFAFNVIKRSVTHFSSARRYKFLHIVSTTVYQTKVTPQWPLPPPHPPAIFKGR